MTLAAGLSGAAASLVQTGLRFTPAKLKPDMQKVSPRKGFERIYGPDGLMQFVKTLVKVLITRGTRASRAAAVPRKTGFIVK